MEKRQLFVLTVLLALIFPGCKKKAGEMPATEYSSIRVTESPLETVDKYPATFRGRQDVDIIPQVSGKITSVHVKEGQRVKKGQTLFIIDQVPYKAALQTALANLESAKAEVASAQLNHNGKQELFAQKVISDFELKKSHNSLLVAKAAMHQAEAQVTNARNDLSYTVISSPCDGVVGTLPYRAGYLVSPGMQTPLTTVSDNSEMYVYFSLPENRMIELIRKYGGNEAVLKSMPSVLLYLNDGSDYDAEGHIESMSGILDKNTGSVSLRAVFPNASGLLHSGGAGNIGLTNKHDNVILIPQGATYELQDKVYAYKVVDGKAHAVQLKVKPVAEKKQYIVLSGLAVGDVIITEGIGNLQDGADVKLKK